MNKLKDLVIIGAGDFGREISDVVERCNLQKPEWNLLGFVDDSCEMQGKTIDGYKVLGDTAWLNACEKEIWAICSIGVSKTRKLVISKCTSPNIKWATIIAPDAAMYRGSSVGEGSIICGGSILAIGVHVGKHVIVNLNCSLGHDDEIGMYNVVNPGVNVSGKVVTGECVDLGTGAKVLQGTRIPSSTVVGAGGVVLKTIEASGTYVGVPVKRVK